MTTQQELLWTPEVVNREGFHENNRPPDDPDAGQNSYSASKPQHICLISLLSKELIFVSCKRIIAAKFF